jgi:hypothetical protein
MSEKTSAAAQRNKQPFVGLAAWIRCRIDKTRDFPDLRADQSNWHFGPWRTLGMKKGSMPQLSQCRHSSLTQRLAKRRKSGGFARADAGVNLRVWQVLIAKYQKTAAISAPAWSD